jgi:hypothetical protein
VIYSYNKSVKFRIINVRGGFVTLSGIFFDEKIPPAGKEEDYYSTSAIMDAETGRILEQIKAMGEEENTLVIFGFGSPLISERSQMYEKAYCRHIISICCS